MILDYKFSKKKQEFTISYIKENGAKSILTYDIGRFLTYKLDQAGQFVNWNGQRCSHTSTDKPSWSDILRFIKSLPEKDRKLLLAKYDPKLYTWDIEVRFEHGVFPEPGIARWPISTISVVNPDLDCLVLGTKELDQSAMGWIADQIYEYLNTCDFWKRMNMRRPKFSYLKFDSEEELLIYFLKNIVSKAPAMAGWNSHGFDWYYISTRIKEFYPNISLAMSSMNWQMETKSIATMKGEKVKLSMPCHTLMVDMMDIIGTFDMAVMPIKENLSLDYIASESPVHLHKIQYDGDLEDLYAQNYPKYVFYSAIDSILVQLIDKCFGTLGILYMQALYVENRISTAMSKIALTESLFFNYFYGENIQIVNQGKFEGDRGELVGAYVKEPTPGKHKMVACYDFSSLYPSSIITCNLSIENFMGKVGREFTEKQIEQLKEDPDYFVSVNGCVYKNDKDYAFKKIQKKLKADRAVGKYLGKQLDALVMLDIEHILKGLQPSDKQYPDNMIHELELLGYPVKKGFDILQYSKSQIEDFKYKLAKDIVSCTRYEQACKLLGNSAYGGSSHVAFEFFNIDLANDITGEARNLIHMMEAHIPQYVQDNWFKMMDLHERMGVKINNTTSPGQLIELVYGDTDSLYMSMDNLLSTIEGYEQMSIREKTELMVKFSTEFLDKHNNEFMTEYYKSRHANSIHEFELETVASAGVWLNVKKRYAQILAYKDGKYYDEDDMPLKVKGLEVIKSSYPKLARDILKGLIREMIETNDPHLIHVMNKRIQVALAEWKTHDVEDVCPSSSVNNYTKYILDDNNKNGVIVAPKCPSVVRACGTYNNLRNVYHLDGEPLYGGKARYYIVKTNLTSKYVQDIVFAFPARQYPSWGYKYAPVDYEKMFKKCVLDPFNRILEAMEMPLLNLRGTIQQSLFDF